MIAHATTPLRSLSLVLLGVGTLAAPNASSATTCPPPSAETPGGVYAASSSGELWRLVPHRDTGVAEAVFIGEVTDGETTYYPTDIAFNDAGSLHAVDGYELICIDPLTARATRLDVADPAVARQTGLAGRAGSLGQLYAAGSERLVRIDVNAGSQVPFERDYGALSCGDEIGDLVFDPTRDVLYGTIECIGGWKGIRSHLVVVDPTDGHIAKDVGPIVDTTGRARYATFGLAFGVDGSLQAGSEDLLMRLDPATGLSKEDLRIVSTAGRQFSRVDGMGSRVCEAPDGHVSGTGLTAGLWRDLCPSPAGSDAVDEWVSRITSGRITTACGALHAAPRTLVDRVRRDGVRRTTRLGTGVLTVPEESIPTRLPPACATALADATAAALNLASGKVNAACLSCTDVDAGTVMSQLGDLLHVAIESDDEATCEALKPQARQLAEGTCP